MRFFVIGLLSIAVAVCASSARATTAPLVGCDIWIFGLSKDAAKGFAPAGEAAVDVTLARLNELASSGQAQLYAKPKIISMMGRSGMLMIGGQAQLKEHPEDPSSPAYYPNYGFRDVCTPAISTDDDPTATLDINYTIPESSGGIVVFRTRTLSAELHGRGGRALVISDRYRGIEWPSSSLKIDLSRNDENTIVTVLSLEPIESAPTPAPHSGTTR